MSGIIEEVVRYLNNKYGLIQAELSGVSIEFPEIDVYDEETIITFWGCGAFVIHQDMLYEVLEDDGYWYPHRSNELSVAFIESRIVAYKIALDYLKSHGKPVYYEFTSDEGKTVYSRTICNYTLEKSYVEPVNFID